MPTEPRPSRRVLKWCSCITVVLVLAGIAALLWVTMSPPGWWTEAGVLAPDASERASALERGASRALSEPRADEEPWTITLSQQDANAWLAHRLARWAENRGVSPVDKGWADFSPPRLRFEEGMVRLGIERDPRVVGLSARPSIENGSLYLRDAACFVGRVEFSADRAAGIAQSLIEQFASTGSGLRPPTEAIFGGTEPFLHPASISLDDGRVVHIERITIEPGRLFLTCRTRSPGKEPSR